MADGKSLVGDPSTRVTRCPCVGSDEVGKSEGRDGWHCSSDSIFDAIRWAPPLSFGGRHRLTKVSGRSIVIPDLYILHMYSDMVYSLIFY